MKGNFITPQRVDISEISDIVEKNPDARFLIMNYDTNSVFEKIINDSNGTRNKNIDEYKGLKVACCTSMELGEFEVL